MSRPAISTTQLQQEVHVSHCLVLRFVTFAFFLFGGNSEDRSQSAVGPLSGVIWVTLQEFGTVPGA
eukprot:4364500-Amphidinium_carterae.1